MEMSRFMRKELIGIKFQRSYLPALIRVNPENAVLA